MAFGEQLQKQRATAFSQLLPVTELTNKENISEALFILNKAYVPFRDAGVKNSEIPAVLAEAKRGKEELRASFGLAKSPDKSLVYSVKLEVNGDEKTVTLRIGTSIELSLHKNGKLREIMFEENGKIMHEKYA